MEFVAYVLDAKIFIWFRVQGVSKLSSKKSSKGKREVEMEGGNCFWKSVGLCFRTPKGYLLVGTFHSAKMVRTIIAGLELSVKEGQCGPLSKTARFNASKGVVYVGPLGFYRTIITLLAVVVSGLSL
ncbi:small ribosomal subunit protein uS17z-like [Cannabis sativa]|uniref:small ribosomal subunit protein uS17z-like n=1 Tax=Cannabis sativa TaxID=3483 RepID=UPI0029CA6D4C|nr:small ribosomal subunit protein uS17z-like [Cannabis sativa]